MLSTALRQPARLAGTAPLLGAIGADLVRYLTSGVIMLAFGFLLGFRTSAGVLAVLAALGLVTVFAFRPLLGVHRAGDGGPRAPFPCRGSAR